MVITDNGTWHRQHSYSRTVAGRYSGAPDYALARRGGGSSPGCSQPTNVSTFHAVPFATKRSTKISWQPYSDGVKRKSPGAVASRRGDARLVCTPNRVTEAHSVSQNRPSKSIGRSPPERTGPKSGDAWKKSGYGLKNPGNVCAH